MTGRISGRSSSFPEPFVSPAGRKWLAGGLRPIRRAKARGRLTPRTLAREQTGMSTAVVWVRDDLRLDDHRALAAALDAHDRVLLAHVFDPSRWGTARLGGLELARLGRPRARFWLESVTALRAEVERRGGGLVVRVGPAVDGVAALAEAVGADTVYAQAHVAYDEQAEERALAGRLEASGRRLTLTSGRTLIPVEALPFPVGELPDVFTVFRKKVEARCPVSPPIPAPDVLPSPPEGVDLGTLPELAQLAPDEPNLAPAILPFVGGEAAGRARLERWTFEADALGTYKQTRNGLLEADDSSKLSPWLAFGCVSPRRVMETVRRYEAERGANESTYWLYFELLWRDYFALLSLREGARMFRLGGVGRRAVAPSRDRERFEAWRTGQTGYPFVDGFMRELLRTGFMSNRGRQNVASFLAKSLGLDWRWGAAWFENRLVDYDPASNWGNWQYAAGVGTDPRDRVFNVVKQAFDYDPEAEHARRWIPELRSMAGGDAHTPWRFGGCPGYPEPVLPPSAFEAGRRHRGPGRGTRRR